jgi:hypothetical protein
VSKTTQHNSIKKLIMPLLILALIGLIAISCMLLWLPSQDKGEQWREDEQHSDETEFAPQELDMAAMILIGGTVLLMGGFVWLLKKNGDMRLAREKHRLKNMAGQAITKASVLLQQSIVEVREAKAAPGDSTIEQRAILTLTTTDDAITWAAELVDDYVTLR